MPILWSGSAPALSIRFAPSCWRGALRYGRGCVSGEAFSKGRDFAAWLGLVPRQISTGDRTILGKISKRGNRYLRVLFVQAAWGCADQSQELATPRAQGLDRGSQKATAPQRARDCAGQ